MEGSMAKQSKQQKETVERVMHEFKHGELESGTGKKVKNPRQAIAIGLSEAGASNQQSPKENRESLRQTKAKERKGETAMQQKEGKGAMARRQKAKAAGKSSSSSRNSGEKTRSELYELAKRKNVEGRSKMNKDELARAVHA
jgi:hypothetical protein